MREVGRLDSGEVLLAASETELNELRLLQAAAAGRAWDTMAFGVPREKVNGDFTDAFSAIMYFVSVENAAITLQSRVNELRDILKTKV